MSRPRKHHPDICDHCGHTDLATNARDAGVDREVWAWAKSRGLVWCRNCEAMVHVMTQADIEDWWIIEGGEWRQEMRRSRWAVVGWRGDRYGEVNSERLALLVEARWANDDDGSARVSPSPLWDARWKAYVDSATRPGIFAKGALAKKLG